MPKVLRCREIGMDCDFEARGESEEDVLTQAAEHARKDHGMNEIPEPVFAQVKAAVHDE